MSEFADFISIDKEQIPYTFEIILNGKLFEFEVNYNKSGDFFTVGLLFNKEYLVQGEKVVLNQILFRQLYEDDNLNLDPRFPSDIIMPQAFNNDVGRLGWDELGESVLLYVASRKDVFGE